MQQASLFDGYTEQEENAIYQTVKPLLKADANWRGILFQISTMIVDICEGHSHADSFMYMADVEQRYLALIEAYEQLGERLQWDLDDALGCRLPDMVKVRLSALGGNTTDNQGTTEWDDWAALVEKETGQHIDLPVVCAPQAQALRHFYVQKGGRSKNHVMRLLIRDLLDIFERATGIEPIIYASPNDDEQRFAGNFYPFAVACLAPVFPETASQLGSPIRRAYRELKNQSSVKV